MDSDGFTLTWTTADATIRKFQYIALKITPVVGAGSGGSGWMWAG
jgi:hypothetical protein